MTIKYSELDRIYARLDQMENTADEYCPTPEDLLEYADDLPRFYPFLLWIDETGYDTEENKENRKALRKFLTENIEFI